MRREEFEELVREGVEGLPQELVRHLDNVDVVAQDWPSPYQIRSAGIGGRYSLLGLYEGIPLTGRQGYNMVLPDKITLFQGPIEAYCHTREEVVREVCTTVAHEIAHHFGISDERLEELGLD